MNTDDLIADLARQAAPMRPLPAPVRRAAAWMAIALACAGAAILVFGLRRNFAAAAADPVFAWTAALALLTTAIAAVASLVLAVPGAERSPVLRTTVVVLTATWAALMAAEVVRAGHGLTRAADWPICFARVALIAIVPAIALFVMLRRAAPLRLAWTGALAATAALAIGSAAIQFVCPMTDAGHALLGHFGPVVALAGLGALAGRRWLAPRIPR